MGDARNTARLGTGWFGGPRRAQRPGGARRRRHEMRPAPESLEGRTLLSVGLDPTWGWGGGIAPILPPDTATTTYYGSIDSIAMQKSQVVALGTLTSDVSGSGGGSPTLTTNMVVTRLTTSGTVDGTFGTGGSTTIPLTGGGVSYDNVSAQDIAVDPTGNIDVLASVTPTSGSISREFMVVQLTSNGTINPSFGTSGFEYISFGPSATPQDASATALAIGPNGKIDVLCSTTTSAGDQVFAVAQLNPNGSLDTSFNGTGMTTVNFQLAGTTPGNEQDSPSGIAVQPNGSILVVGSASLPPPTTGPTLTQAAVARLTATGALDTSFNGTGKLTYSYNLGGNSDDAASSVILDGSLIAIGGSTIQQPTSTTSPSAPLPAYATVTVLNSNGTFDTGFNGSGKFMLTFSQGGVPFNTVSQFMSTPVVSLVAVQDGSLVVGTNFRQQTSYSGPNGALFAHVTSSGSLDPMLGPNGVAMISPASVDGRLLLQADGKVIVSSNGDIVRTTAPPPVVVSSTITTIGKGKRVKATGLTITFETGLNTILANNSNAYVVLPMKGKRPITLRKKGGAFYDPTTGTLTLRFAGKVKATPGFRLTVMPGGIIGADSIVFLNGQPMPIIVTRLMTTS